jgi:hypothetical protein
MHHAASAAPPTCESLQPAARGAVSEAGPSLSAARALRLYFPTQNSQKVGHILGQTVPGMPLVVYIGVLGAAQNARRRRTSRRRLMERVFSVVLILVWLASATGEATAKARPTQFWNLTRNTISEFYLAPTGTSNWGPNQCKNDKDGSVDSDERLRITDVASGTYDAKFTDATGRVCIVRNIKIEAGAIFSIEEKDLASCVQH